MKYKLKNTYKTISQVVKILNSNSQKKTNNQTHTLRYWEKQFKQIKPIKINNRRYYDQKNIDILLKIQYLLKNQGMTINGVKKYLNDENSKLDVNDNKTINKKIIKTKINKISKLLKSIKNNG